MNSSKTVKNMPWLYNEYSNDICTYMNELNLSCKDTVIQRLLIKFNNNLLKLGEHPSLHIQQLYDKVQEQEHIISNGKNKNALGFFTFNFKPEITLGQAIVLMKDIINKKWLKLNEYYYCYEQRGNTLETMGQGLHVHLLFKKPPKKSPQHCKNECWNNFKKYCDLKEDIIFEKHFLFIPESWKQDKIEYILGNKHKDPDGSKKIKVIFDKIYREKNNIKNIYSNNEEP